MLSAKRSTLKNWLAFGQVCALMTVGWSAPSFAQSNVATNWPNKPIKFVVPYPPGGPLDQVARLLAEKLRESLGQPVIVENRAGAGGNIGADAVAKAAPDGYTIVMGAVATHAINPALYAKMPYDANKDFVPVCMAAIMQHGLAVGPLVPASVTDVKGFLTWAKLTD